MGLLVAMPMQQDFLPQRPQERVNLVLDEEFLKQETLVGDNLGYFVQHARQSRGRVHTALDSDPMAKKGEAGKALGIALASSAIGGIFGTIVLMLLAPPMGQFALNFGPAEYFALAILEITAIWAIGGGSILKGLVAGHLGLGIATVGLDPITEDGRLRLFAAQAEISDCIVRDPADRKSAIARPWVLRPVEAACGQQSGPAVFQVRPRA